MSERRAAAEVHRRGAAPSKSALFFGYDRDLGWRGHPPGAGRFSGWEFSIITGFLTQSGLLRSSPRGGG